MDIGRWNLLPHWEDKHLIGLPRRRSRGATLLEVMLSSGLMALLVTVALTVVVAISRYYQRTLTSYDLHQSALTGLTTLSREMSASHNGSLVASADGLVFAHPTLDTTVVPAVLVWDRWICYYQGTVQGEPALVRVEEPISPPATTPPAVPPGKTVAYFRSAGLPSRLIAPYLASFVVSSGDPADVELALSRRVGKVYAVRVRLKVPFRN